MTDHEQYEILCVLAATGEISDTEVQDLRFHLAGCRDCRRRLSEYGQLSAQFLPMFGDRHTPVAPPENMSARFAETARRHGLAVRMSAASGMGLLSRLGPSTLRMAVVAAAVCAVAAFVTVHARRREQVQTVAIKEVVHTTTGDEMLAVASARPAAAASPLTPATEAAEVQRLEERLSNLRGENQAVAAERDRLQAQVVSLSNDLAAAQRGMAQSTEEAAAVRQQLENKHELELQNLAALAQDHQQIAELQGELDQRAEDLKHYQSMLSSSDQARNLIVARNLHIIDVHDANGNGDQQLPFGRIFYTEGKSLVFYAYDLPRAGQPNPQVSFHVWGGEQGSEESAKSLGIFRSESSDGRWVLTCDDPHVLARVDTVFVTAEKGHRSAQKPSGKRILYAFLGDQPNHP